MRTSRTAPCLVYKYPIHRRCAVTLNPSIAKFGDAERITVGSMVIRTAWQRQVLLLALAYRQRMFPYLLISASCYVPALWNRSPVGRGARSSVHIISGSTPAVSVMDFGSPTQANKLDIVTKVSAATRTTLISMRLCRRH